MRKASLSLAVASHRGSKNSTAVRWPLAAALRKGERTAFAALPAADLALAASGTVSLELAANAVPMVRDGKTTGYMSIRTRATEQEIAAVEPLGLLARASTWRRGTLACT